MSTHDSSRTPGSDDLKEMRANVHVLAQLILDHKLSEIEAAARAVPRPAHWYFFRIEVEGRAFRSRDEAPIRPHTYARAVYGTKNEIGIWKCHRAITVSTDAFDLFDALDRLLQELSDPHEVPWSRMSR